MKYFGAAALLTLLAACSNDDMENASYQDDPLAVRITAMAGKNVITRSNPTDDTNQSVFKENDRISVATSDQGAVIYKKENSVWKPESGYLKWTTSPLTFNAYYPVDKNNASMTTFDVPISQNSPEAIENADYMTYSGTQSKPASASGSITLTLERKMARVVISNIDFHDQYKTGYSVTAIKVHGNTSGYENGTTKTGNIGVESYYKAEEKNFYALLSPTTQDDAATFLTVTVKAEDAPDTDKGTDLTVKGIPALVASNSYTYTLTVGKDMIAVSSVTVKEWNDGGSVIENGGEGEAEEETDGPNATTHTITTSKAGQINSNTTWIAEAINGGTSLTVTGPMNSEDLTAIADYLKENNGTTIDIDLSDAKLTAIPNAAFMALYVEGYYDERIKSLGKVSLPTALTEIGENAFRFCPSFTVANWDELTTLTTIGPCAFMTSGLNGDITLPESITTIGDMAFYQTAITSIVFPSSITSIDVQMFYQSQNLKAVTFKGNVTFFDIRVFEGCSALEEIDLSACTAVPTYQDATIFEGFSESEMKGIALKVKSSLVESFKADAIWGKCNVVPAE